MRKIIFCALFHWFYLSLGAQPAVASQSRADSLESEIRELKRELVAIKERNDGRYETMAWASGGVLALLVLLLGVSFINSRTAAKNAALEEVERQTDGFKALFETEIRKATEMNERMDKIRLGTERALENLTTAFENLPSPKL